MRTWIGPAREATVLGGESEQLGYGDDRSGAAAEDCHGASFATAAIGSGARIECAHGDGVADEGKTTIATTIEAYRGAAVAGGQ